jgi:hypothetical protein
MYSKETVDNESVHLSSIAFDRVGYTFRHNYPHQPGVAEIAPNSGPVQ